MIQCRSNKLLIIFHLYFSFVSAKLKRIKRKKNVEKRRTLSQKGSLNVKSYLPTANNMQKEEKSRKKNFWKIFFSRTPFILSFLLVFSALLRWAIKRKEEEDCQQFLRRHLFSTFFLLPLLINFDSKHICLFHTIKLISSKHQEHRAKDAEREI